MAITGSNDLGNGRVIMVLTHNPKSVSTDAKKGSLAVREDALAEMYRKIDDGSTTNWEEVRVLVAGVTQSIVWFHLLPQPASSGTPSDASSTASAYESKARFLFNFDRLNVPGTTLSGKFYVRGRVNSGNGDVRLLNVTNGVELAVVNFTETSETTKEASLSGVPTSGIKLVEIQMRRNTLGTTITVVSASTDFVLNS